jgi:hypothetical protein
MCATTKGSKFTYTIIRSVLYRSLGLEKWYFLLSAGKVSVKT